MPVLKNLLNTARILPSLTVAASKMKLSLLFIATETSSHKKQGIGFSFDHVLRALYHNKLVLIGENHTTFVGSFAFKFLPIG